MSNGMTNATNEKPSKRVLRFKVTPEDEQRLKIAYKLAGSYDFSEWARGVLLAEATRLSGASNA